MTVLRLIWHILVRTWGWFWRLVGLLILLLMLRFSSYPLYGEWNAISLLVGVDKFDYLGWELKAVSVKAVQTLWGIHPFITEEERSQIARDYMSDLGRLYQIEGEIDGIYLTEPPEQADDLTVNLRDERDSLARDLGERQPLVESILEGQVAMVLAEEGFSTLGQVLPPVSMHFTRMPNLLIVSPRDRIERRVEMAVDPLPVEQAIALEERILASRDMDALVVPLGGMAIFPAMIQESANLPWIVETFAHEWIHHYFFFYPLGLSYFVDTGPAGREALSINETAANVFGREIGRKVLARYYPEYVQEAGNDAEVVLTRADEQEPEFDFGRNMHLTRVTVDGMLNTVSMIEDKAHTLRRQGQIVWAEQFDQIADEHVTRMRVFMDQRQQSFVEQGFRIRKLNLAYFAFYGGYQADGVPGIAGTDPTGPAIEAILAMSDNLHRFATIMRGITSREELLSVRDAMRAG